MSLTWNSNSVTSLSGRMHWELTATWLKLLLSRLLLAVSAILNVWLSEMAPKQNDDVLVTSLPRATIKDRLRMTHRPQTLTCLEKWPIVSVCGKMCRISTFTLIFTTFLLTFNCTNYHRHISAAVLLPWTQASCLRRMACACREFKIPPSLCFWKETYQWIPTRIPIMVHYSDN